MSSTPTLIDSHCHIVFRNFDDDLDEVASRWREAGVKALLHACVEPSEIPAIRALADRFPENQAKARTSHQLRSMVLDCSQRFSLSGQ